MDPIAGKGFKIGCIILACKGILIAAIHCNDAREFTLPIFLCSFEHHVLKQMGKPCFTHGLILTAHLIPYLKGYYRRLVLFKGYHFEAIREGELLDFSAVGVISEEV